MSLADGLSTVSDVIDLLERHGVDVRDAREIATDFDGETIKAQLHIAVPIGTDLATDDPKAAIDEACETLDEAGDTTEAIREFGDRVQEGVAVETDGVPAETEGATDTGEEHIDNGGGPDVSVLPEVTRRGDPFHGEPADARVGRSTSDEPETDDTGDEEIGVYSARDYGVPLSGVADHVDADRVTVVGQPYGADLVPGTGADGPDYAVQQHNIQLGNPGREVIGVAPDEDIRAVRDGDRVRLELVDESGDQEDSAEGDETGPDRVWCGYCGAGPFQAAGDVESHHDREGHAGEPVVRESNPADSDLVDEAEADTEDATADGGVAVQGPPSTDTAAGVTCQNCRAQVSQRYAKVWAPEDQEDIGPRTCPNCDKVREPDGTVREPRSTGGERDV